MAKKIVKKELQPELKSFAQIDKEQKANLIKLSGTRVETLPIDHEDIVVFEDLRVSYKQDSTYNLKQVIRGVDLSVKKGETLAIIGESGSGKSVITSTIYGLQGQNAVFESGKVIVKGQEVQEFKEEKWEKSKLRGKIVSAVFQNPMSSLNPTMKIGKQIVEGILINDRATSYKIAWEMAINYLEKMRINEPEKIMKMYPHQLSGGMKQRVVIAAIIACQPEIIVMDEPTTALDPSVQAEVLGIVRQLQKEYNLTIIFITHDLGVVASVADRIAILYAGQVVELGTKEEVIWKPAHPYTWGLLKSMPDLNKGTRLSTIKGSVPNDLSTIKGDAFAARNDFAMEVDFVEEPPYFQLSDTHFAKSWLYDERAPKIEVPNQIRERWNKKGGKNA